MDNDTISRQAAIDALEAKKDKSAKGDIGCFYNTIIQNNIDALKGLPSAQPESAIPLQWIEAQIEWLKSLDNAFSTLTAGQISAMVNKWKDEQNE